MAFSDLWKRIKESDTFVPTRIYFSDDHTDLQRDEPSPFEENQHYFSVTVNEMFLSAGRQWFKGFDPMVLVVSEFLYDGQRVEVPYVVGPSILNKYANEIPEGMIFSNTRVAGIHPYKGDRLTLSIVLNRVAHTNYAEKMLGLVEDVANSLDYASALSSYLKVGKAVTKGLESMLDLGDTKPLIGLRNEFDPAKGQPFAPGYFALVNAPETETDTSRFWVKEDRLHYGDSLESSKLYREHDFVLVHIQQAGKRTDEEALDFYKQWKEVLDYIGQQTEMGDKQKLFIKGKLFGLYNSVYSSPDLTRAQAKALFKSYKDRAEEMQEELSFFEDGSRSLLEEGPEVSAEVEEAIALLSD